MCRTCRGASPPPPREELEQLIREAIEFHVEGMRLHGEPIPEPTVEAGSVSVAI